MARAQAARKDTKTEDGWITYVGVVADPVCIAAPAAACGGGTTAFFGSNVLDVNRVFVGGNSARAKGSSSSTWRFQAARCVSAGCTVQRNKMARGKGTRSRTYYMYSNPSKSNDFLYPQHTGKCSKGVLQHVPPNHTLPHMPGHSKEGLHRRGPCSQWHCTVKHRG